MQFRMSSDHIQGFKVLPLVFSSSSTSCHDIFIKEHSVRASDSRKPPGQTLFLLNIPPYATEDSLKNAFSLAGNITRAILEQSEENHLSNDGFKRAYIVFDKREALLKALRLTALNPLSSDQQPLKVGIEKWIDEYNSSIHNPEKLQKEIDTFMATYDEKQNNNKIKDDAQDDEGWTLVTKSGRKPGLSRKESVELKINEKTKNVSKKKELKNFYTFQIRESQKQHIATLRKNFEEAKQKVELMKKSRKFKPNAF